MDVSQSQTHLTPGSTSESTVKSQTDSVERKGWRIPGILFGLGTHVLFIYTVRNLFLFLRDGTAPLTNGLPVSHPLFIDVLLTLQFAVIHSLLLHPRVQRPLTRLIPRPFYGCFFCCMTCLTLLITIAWWKPGEVVLYNARGTWGGFAIQTGFYGSWIALFYSLFLSGFGYQTGWTPWWYWFCKLPQPKREFREQGAYRLFRHPIYLSFLGLIWFTPQMSTDHVFLTGVWTVYIFVGSYLKDERLAFYLGDRYRTYQQRVPGYPLLSKGPLGYWNAPEHQRIQVEEAIEIEPHQPRNAA